MRVARDGWISGVTRPMTLEAFPWHTRIAFRFHHFSLQPW
jgi:hypothetical protein